MNYYRRYIGDYQRDTMHLSLLEHGAFTMLLDSFYAQDGKLPITHSVLFRLCRAITDEEKEAVSKVADEFFPVGGGIRSNARGERELAAAIPRIESAKKNGEKGGRPHKITQSETQPDSKTITLEEPDTKAIPTTNLHIKPKTFGGKPPAYSLEFEECWSSYPKRSGNNPKLDAYRQWCKRILEGVKAEDMIAGAKRYFAWCEASGNIGSQMVMQAVRFLGDGKLYEQEFDIQNVNGGGNGNGKFHPNAGFRKKLAASLDASPTEKILNDVFGEVQPLLPGSGNH